MPQYRYKGTDAKGKKVKGLMTAANETELYQKLRDMDIYMTESKDAGRENAARQIPSKALSEFCRSLGTLQSSGVSLVRALTIISQEETTKEAYRKVYREVLRLVRQGGLLSDAMQEQGEAFPEILIFMMRSAEASGSMDKVCMRMAEHFEKDYKTRGKIRSAMTYPIILLILTLIVVLIIFTFVIPQFADLFAGMPTLPLPTRIVMAISDGLESDWPRILIVVFCLWLTFNTLRKIPKVRLKLDQLKLKLPVIGKLLKIIYTARFARTLCSLYTSGLPMVTAIQLGRNTIGNTYIESQFDQVITLIRGGSNLSDAIRSVDGFTLKLTSTVMIGEETGRLDVMLESMADMMEYEADMAMNRLITMLEPIMIVIMAFIVGFVIVSVIVPIYGSYEQIGASAS